MNNTNGGILWPRDTCRHRGNDPPKPVFLPGRWLSKRPALHRRPWSREVLEAAGLGALRFLTVPRTLILCGADPPLVTLGRPLERAHPVGRYFLQTGVRRRAAAQGHSLTVALLNPKMLHSGPPRHF